MSRPNILLLLTDSQQARTIEPETACRTPTIDRLARSGTRFTRCYAASPICSPSRATLMTGILPHNHGVVRNNHVVEPFRAELRDDVETWSQRLAAEGYHLGYFGKWHVERSGALDRFGFDQYELPVSEEFEENFAAHRRKRDLEPRPDHSPAGLLHSRTVSQDGYGDRLLYGTHDEPEGTRAYYTYSRGIEFVRDAADWSEPWCLTVSTSAPHDPFLAPQELYEAYDRSIPKPTNFDDRMRDKPDLYRRLPGVWDDLSWAEYAETIAHYYAYCTHVDRQIGRLLDALADTGQLAETVVVFTSDHGDMMGGHRLFTHGFTAFEEIYRVPLVVRQPGGRAGQTCDDPVQVHDLASTIVDVADAGSFPPEANTSSVHPRSGDEELYASYSASSLLPFLDGDRPADYRPEAYAEYDGDSFGVTQRVYWHEQYKYVYNMFAGDELYDLETDPGETTNLAADPRHEEIETTLAKRMWEIARDTGDYTITTNHYWMNRIAPVGPEDSDR